MHHFAPWFADHFWTKDQPSDICDKNAVPKLRAAQITAVIKVTPLMLAANIVCMVTFIITIVPSLDLDGYSFAILCIWAILVGLLTVVGLTHAWQKRKTTEPEHASSKAIRKAVVNSTVLSLAWAFIPAYYYPAASFDAKLVILAIASGLLGAGAVSLYVVPTAMRNWVLVIAAGCAIAAYRSGSPGDLAVLALLVAYSISLIKAGTTMARIFIKSVASEIDSSEKSETIGVLLGDFSENAADWLWEADKSGKITVGNDQFEEHLGSIITNLDPRFAIHNKSAETTIGGLPKIYLHFCEQKTFKNLLISRRDEEGDRWIRLSGKPLYDRSGEYIGYRGVASDISEAKHAEQKVMFLAQNDVLTGLVNRLHFTQKLDEMFERRAVGNWAIMCIDLDGFKSVNDHHGHAAGDQLLTEIAARLKQNIRKDDIAARFGGDEFVLLLSNIKGTKDLELLAQKLIDALEAPFVFQQTGAVLEISASIGIALGMTDGDNPYSLLNNADLALYRAKSEGKGTFRFFEIEMDQIVKDMRRFELDLREAVRNNDFTVAYQPLVSADHKRATGFEALVRWNHPTRGPVAPSEFIPVAERIGLISQIGDFVLFEACSQAVSWPKHLSIAINLSPHQFINNHITDSVTRVLMETGLDPKRLELEITEGLFMEQTDAVTYALRELKSMGVSIAMDDFGTGYSSLSYLLKFPFDKLKIDQSFIQSIEEDKVARNILEAIAKLGNVLDLQVTIEGVETSDQVKALQGLDCTYFQGYLFSKPLDCKDLPQYLLSQIGSEMLEEAKRGSREIEEQKASFA